MGFTAETRLYSATAIHHYATDTKQKKNTKTPRGTVLSSQGMWSTYQVVSVETAITQLEMHL